MSPRAAWRLDSLGYDAYDYVSGKQDWLAYGLPYDGAADLVGDHVITDVPGCAGDEPIRAVRESLRSSPFGLLVVRNAAGVVLGRLGVGALDAADEDAVERHMQEGPTTVRPGADREPLIERMQLADVDAVIVTRADGTLVGLFQRPAGDGHVHRHA